MQQIIFIVVEIILL